MGFFNKKLAHPEFNTTMVLLQVQGDYYYFSRVICPNRVIPPVVFVWYIIIVSVIESR